MVGELIPFAVALGVAALAPLLRAMARRQYEWPTTRGTILVSTSGLASNYYPEIWYEYFQNGRRFVGLTVRSHEFAGNLPGAARRVLVRYPVGASVTVYFDPGNPEDAVLEPGGDRNFFRFLYVFAGFWLFIGLKLAVT
jgi:Protein of unknown function (DUF3592)